MGERENHAKAVIRAADRMRAAGLFGARREVEEAIAIRTGSPRLDHGLGGGLMSGITEIFGPESSGKTALAGFILAMAQRQGKECALALTEDLDVDYWKDMGVDMEKTALVQAEEIGSLTQVAEDFIKGNDRVMVIDSITALRSKKWRTVLEDFERWIGPVNDLVQFTQSNMPTSSCLVITSQVRHRRSIDPRKMFADGYDSASRSISDAFVVRLELSKTDVHDTEYRLVVNIVSNVLSSPGRYVVLPMHKGMGVMHVQDLVSFAEECGVITKSGSWYVLPGGSRYQGLAAATLALKADKVTQQELLDSLYNHV